jgi:hypothetical protein
MNDDWRDQVKEARRRAKDVRREMRRQSFGETFNEDWRQFMPPPDKSLQDDPNDSVEERARKRVERRARKRAQFFRQLMNFLLINGICWVIFIATAATGHGGWAQFPWPIFVTLGLGIGLAQSGWSLYQESSVVQDRHEEEVQREIEREMRRRGMTSDKPKRGLDDSNDRPMVISDEGELIPAEDASEDENDNRPNIKSAGQQKSSK